MAKLGQPSKLFHVGKSGHEVQVLVDLIKEIAAGRNATPAQTALAWEGARKPWIVPISNRRYRQFAGR
ncbi:hypothetical protein DESC_270006 [Desulfosarcina cetonica]|nr:hypothetical protein DESC_270006 [Desulfosarcina cetonica]